MRKTKIVCTLGPATDNEQVLRSLMQSGMNVARINMSHGDHEIALERVNMVKRIRTELNLPIALLLDTKGPEIRTGDFEEPITLKNGETFTLCAKDMIGNEKQCSVSYKKLADVLSKGSRVLINDGLIELHVTQIKGEDVVCEIINGGVISSRKGINIPSISLPLPFLSEADKADIKFAVDNDFDFIAASFTRSAEDVLQLREELESLDNFDIKIIAKIENHEGVNNIDRIIDVSDGIMVARGDLGVEIPLEEIPILQKKLIKKVYNAGKQVITATQMLESMVNNPRPTRAESTDIANAIYDGTSAIMLSGETAAGKYPIEAVKTMALIAERTEADINYMQRFTKLEPAKNATVTSAISHATCMTAHDLGAVAIIAVSKTGQTARMLSRYRPQCPIVCCAMSEKVCRQMNMSWGVTPLLLDEKNSTDELFDAVVSAAQDKNLVQNGDVAVIVAGVPLGISGTTNLIKVHLVGNILVTGECTKKSKVCSNVCVCKSDDPESLRKFKDGDILVISETSNKLLEIMKRSSGIITESDGMNSHAAIVGLTLNKPVLVGAKNATKLLKSGITVILDGEKGIVMSSNK